MPTSWAASKWFRPIVVLIGVGAIALLFWKLNWRVVAATVGHIGYGILFVISLQIIALMLNTIGWRLSFRPDAAKSYGLVELASLWLAMDGINYFIPTGTVAGEIARTSMLRDVQPIETRAASVVISRIGQTVAQIAFVLIGFVFLVSRIPAIRRRGWMTSTATGLLVTIGVALLLYMAAGWRWFGKHSRRRNSAVVGRLRATRAQICDYYAAHPWRFLASIVIFLAAYAWVAVEAYWICRFIRVPVRPFLALTIEVLSVAVDGALFFIPAKIGSQELGKTAIFSLLRLPLQGGAAFGVVRHAREIFWAIAGFGIYSRSKSRPSTVEATASGQVLAGALSNGSLPNASFMGKENNESNENCTTGADSAGRGAGRGADESDRPGADRAEAGTARFGRRSVREGGRRTAGQR